MDGYRQVLSEGTLVIKCDFLFVSKRPVRNDDAYRTRAIELLINSRVWDNQINVFVGTAIFILNCMLCDRS